jgi:Rps23 Pro-64 3,4-dihydroxylase Tpa1-like proline 4-hydroxylase
MDFILEIPNNLSLEVCEDMIKRFEKDDRVQSGITTTSDKIIPKVMSSKHSTDLYLSRYDDWKDIDEYLHKQLLKGLEEYKAHMTKVGYGNSIYRFFQGECKDSGYQIQKTVPGEYYGWHDDSLASNGRFLTYLWYLTSHEPINDGGGTAFHPLVGDGGKVIKPEQGKLLIFPATWTYVHAGLPLIRGNPKYICTGWMMSDKT